MENGSPAPVWMLPPSSPSPDSRLWDFDNVILTPHISGGQEDYLVHATALFCENLKRYLKGKKLMNVISRKRGY